MADTGWGYQREGNMYFPMPGTTRLLDRTLTAPGPHHFLVRTICLDEIAESDHHLADFFLAVARVR